MNGSCASLRCLAAASLVIALTTSGAGQQPTPISHASVLGAPRIDRLGDGTVVVSLVATGDLQGLVTLNLHPAANSSYSGEWSFSVAHADDTDPVTGIDPDLNGDAPRGDANGVPDIGFLRLIQQGSVEGFVSFASVRFDPSGTLAAVSASLTLTQGKGEFAGATGSGAATLGTVTLLF